MIDPKMYLDLIRTSCVECGLLAYYRGTEQYGGIICISNYDAPSFIVYPDGTPSNELRLHLLNEAIVEAQDAIAVDGIWTVTWNEQQFVGDTMPPGEWSLIEAADKASRASYLKYIERREFGTIQDPKNWT